MAPSSGPSASTMVRVDELFPLTHTADENLLERQAHRSAQQAIDRARKKATDFDTAFAEDQKQALIDVVGEATAEASQIDSA